MNLLDAKIPVTVITGFLGAGKTTFINQLIKKYPDKRFAIIENEFGEINIDQELVIDAAEGIFELSNGCICCTLNQDLIELLHRLEDPKYNFNHILIETTGIAEPDGIASVFLNLEGRSKYFLDGTVCLIDAVHALKTLNENQTARKQVSFADLILINKTDAADQNEEKYLLSELRKYNHGARTANVAFADFGSIDILDIGAYDPDRVGFTLGSAINYRQKPSHFMLKESDIEAHSFVLDQALDPHKFEHWASVVLHLYNAQIYRIKGILWLEGEERKVIFQSVRNSTKIDIGEKWHSSENKATRLVCIVKNVERKSLEKGLKQCVYLPKIQSNNILSRK
ncbi:MAG: GTP-binding protein [Cyclobacteriaceae bacterium]|nr:GTP-binding protein [Cyclobacteriaceae bacterium]